MSKKETGIIAWIKAKFLAFKGGTRTIVKSYSEFLSETLKPLKKISNYMYMPICSGIKSISLSRIFFSTPTSWTLLSLFICSIVAVALSILSFRFAMSDIQWFVSVWDNWVLSVYAQTRFQDTWWIILTGMMILTWLLIRPLAVSRIGRWRGRFWASLISYVLFFTLFSILSWQFQSYILGLKWFFVVGLFLLCHFLFIFSIAILANTTTRIPGLNKQYIESTEKIIWNEKAPIDYIFHKSLYGVYVSELAGKLFDGCLGWVFGFSKKGKTRESNTTRKGRIYQALRKYFLQIVSLFSFAWLFDRIFGGAYYVMHFEMILRDLTTQKRKEAWDAMQQKEDVLENALMKYAVSGLFDVRDLDKEAHGESLI